MVQKINLNQAKKQNLAQPKFLMVSIVISIICLVTISLMSILLFSFKYSAKTTNQFAEINKDSDNDGLSDYAERLYGTDQNDPDTDNNGIKDSAQLRNQLEQTASTTPSLDPTGNTADGIPDYAKATYGPNIKNIIKEIRQNNTQSKL
ncbi:MAG: thrombospondin type 3 repeat-containing protein [Patescibacteria group bacterium]